MSPPRMVKIPPSVTDERQFVLSTRAPTLGQKRLALAVVLVLLATVALVVGPFSSLQPGTIPAFIPGYAVALAVIDVITAVVLFAQFSILRSLALLLLANGYLSTALIVIPWMLTFPGVFTSTGLLGAGLQTTNWLFIFWHIAFPAFVLAYALSKDASPATPPQEGSAGSAILFSGLLTAAGVCALTLLATAGHAYLPRTMLDQMHFSAVRLYISGFQFLWCVAVLIVLGVRLRSVLDLCLSVVMCAYVIELLLIVVPTPMRFTIGWYAARAFGLVSASLVLFALLYEITTLYPRLLRAILAERREREARLMTGDTIAVAVAHEVRQPLTGIIAYAQAGSRWLARPTPDLEEANAAFKGILASGRRAAAVIESILAIFRKDDLDCTSFDVNDLIGEALALVRADLEEHRITVHAEADARLPSVSGDRTQLRQVLLTLIRNAIDAMASSRGPRNLSLRTAVHNDDNVLVAVGDTGPGIGVQDADTIFNPLVTTQAGGTGMGLAICRSILKAHHGRIWVAPNEPRGAVFRFILQADRAPAPAHVSPDQPSSR
jgi:signal transduction histidine kinase